MDEIARIEAWLEAELAACPVVRVDELLRGEWEVAVGREWFEAEDPCREFLEWVRAQPPEEDWDMYYRVLPTSV